MKAVREGRWNKVKALIYLLTHSFSGRALAILRVISNSGARTPGVDGILWNTLEAKSAAFQALHGTAMGRTAPQGLHSQEQRQPSPGLPEMTDRAMQALYLLGLDPTEPWPTATMAFGWNDAVQTLWTNVTRS